MSFMKSYTAYRHTEWTAFQFIEWEEETTMMLQAEGLWPYVCPLTTEQRWYPIDMGPSPDALDSDVRRAFNDQLKLDSKAKLLIYQRCPSTVQRLLPNDPLMPAREMWGKFEGFFLPKEIKWKIDDLDHPKLENVRGYASYFTYFEKLRKLYKRIGIPLDQPLVQAMNQGLQPALENHDEWKKLIDGNQECIQKGVKRYSQEKTDDGLNEAFDMIVTRTSQMCCSMLDVIGLEAKPANSKVATSGKGSKKSSFFS
jgi:hypothetical protein